MAVVAVKEGSIRLSEEAQKHLRIDANDKVAITLLPGGKLEIAPTRQGDDLQSFFGSLYRPENPTLPLEEIKQTIEDAWAGKR